MKSLRISETIMAAEKKLPIGAGSFSINVISREELRDGSYLKYFKPDEPIHVVATTRKYSCS